MPMWAYYISRVKEAAKSALSLALHPVAALWAFLIEATFPLSLLRDKKDSAHPLSVGFPGGIKSSCTLLAQASITLPANSGPLSVVIS